MLSNSALLNILYGSIQVLNCYIKSIFWLLFKILCFCVQCGSRTDNEKKHSLFSCLALVYGVFVCLPVQA